MPNPPAPPRARRMLAALLTDAAPLDLRLIGRTLLHSAVVGVVAGILGVLFFAGLGVVESILLGKAVGHRPLTAAGEKMIEVAIGPEHPTFRPWLLLFIPAIGALLGGVISAKLAQEAQGGGGDAVIEAIHHKGGHIRKRVIWVKGIASIFTLGSGGSGGREGPTMLIGGAIGSNAASASSKRIAMERRPAAAATVSADAGSPARRSPRHNRSASASSSAARPGSSGGVASARATAATAPRGLCSTSLARAATSPSATARSC